MYVQSLYEYSQVGGVRYTAITDIQNWTDTKDVQSQRLEHSRTKYSLLMLPTGPLLVSAAWSFPAPWHCDPHLGRYGGRDFYRMLWIMSTLISPDISNRTAPEQQYMECVDYQNSLSRGCDHGGGTTYILDICSSLTRCPSGMNPLLSE